MKTHVDFDTAKLLKEKEYNLPTDSFEQTNGIGTTLNVSAYFDYSILNKIHPDVYSTKIRFEKFGLNSSLWQTLKGCYVKPNNLLCYYAPTITEVVCWLYEKHGIWIFIYPLNKVNEDFSYNICIDNKHIDENNNNRYNSPTKAYLEAINYTLKNLIK